MSGNSINSNFKVIDYKATSPGRRHKVFVKDLDLSSDKFFPLLRPLKRKKFVNNKGNLVNFHREFGKKKLYRLVDFKRNFEGLFAKIIRFDYDPNRNCGLALLEFENGSFCYILKTEGMAIGDIIVNGFFENTNVTFNSGSSFLLKDIPVGSIICNIEGSVSKGGQFLKSAGTFGQLLMKTEKHSLIQFSSGFKKYFDNNCRATIGIVSGGPKKFSNIGKAGTNRFLGKRPHVRGVAMNPVDHPHGGGNGKTSGGRPSVSRWGKFAKGVVGNRKKRLGLIN